MALDLRNRRPQSAVALLSTNDDRVTLVVAISSDLIAQGLKAGAMVKIGSTVLGGGGGGKDDFAQGGGTSIAQIPQAVAELKAALGSR